jgi:hypothetical protein
MNNTIMTKTLQNYTKKSAKYPTAHKTSLLMRAASWQGFKVVGGKGFLGDTYNLDVWVYHQWVAHQPTSFAPARNFGH